MLALLGVASLPVSAEAASPAKDRFTAPQREHWAFQEVVRPPLPDVAAPGWALNPIDRFILAKLPEKQITPSSEADKVTLLRRVTFDLTGLPPDSGGGEGLSRRHLASGL